MSEEPLIAVFVDFENLAIGVRAMKAGDFKIQLVLKRLLEKGRIVYKRAYCDWRNYPDAVREFHGQGIELIDIPQTVDIVTSQFWQDNDATTFDQSIKYIGNAYVRNRNAGGGDQINLRGFQTASSALRGRVSP